MQFDRELGILVGGVLLVLVLATIAGQLLARRVRSDATRVTVNNLNARIAGWWVMCAVFGIAVFTGGIGSVVLFGIVSFLALREYVTVTFTSRSDHQALFWTFFVITPVQYWIVADKWYGLFAIFIPVYAFLFLPIANTLRGDVGISSRAERVAIISAGLVLAPWGFLPWAIYVLAASAWVTVLQRVLFVRKQLRETG